MKLIPGTGYELKISKIKIYAEAELGVVYNSGVHDAKKQAVYITAGITLGIRLFGFADDEDY